MVADEGFAEFATARLSTLSRVAYLLTGDHDAAEELVQNALLVVSSRWQRVAAADDPMAYMRRVLYHELVSSWRRNRYLRSEFSASEVPDHRAVRDEASDAVTRVVIEHALARLTPRQRAVLVLRFFEDLTEAESAAVLGCSIGTVMGR